MAEPDDKTPQGLNDETQKALARKFDAEARKEIAVAKKEEAWAMLAEQQSRRESLEHEKYIINYTEQVAIMRAMDKHYRKYQYRFPVSENSVAECLDTLNLWHRQDEKDLADGTIEKLRPFEIVFYSPGGGVMPGMRLFDHIQWLRGEGHYVTTCAMGYAASMGGILLQAGDKREIGKNAFVLIHELSFGAAGDMGDMIDAVEMAEIIQKRVIDIFCSRAKETGRPGHLTPAKMKRKWQRKDWWLSSDEAYRLGVVDEIR